MRNEWKIAMAQLYSTDDAYMRASQEDRCAPRIRLDIACTLRPSGSTGFKAVLTDLSLGGFAVQAVTGMRPGTLCWLTLGPLKGLEAEVVWNDGASVGCAFHSLLNPAVFASVVRG
jgi:PilZ domain